MIFPGFPGILSFFQVFQVKWEPCLGFTLGTYASTKKHTRLPEDEIFKVLPTNFHFNLLGVLKRISRNRLNRVLIETKTFSVNDP